MADIGSAPFRGASFLPQATIYRRSGSIILRAGGTAKGKKLSSGAGPGAADLRVDCWVVAVVSGSPGASAFGSALGRLASSADLAALDFGSPGFAAGWNRAFAEAADFRAACVVADVDCLAVVLVDRALTAGRRPSISSGTYPRGT